MKSWKVVSFAGAAALAAAVVLSAAAAGAADPAPVPAAAKAAAPTDAKTRGEYLVKSGGCADCHAPWKMGPSGPAPDLSRGLSGHPEGLKFPAPPKLPPGPWNSVFAATMTAWAGPWGVSYTANITPDPETGIGKWTDSDFVQAMKTGKHMGRGRPILPPMPWPAMSNLTEDDLKAVYAYLMAQPPVRNRVPDPVPPAK